MLRIETIEEYDKEMMKLADVLQKLSGASYNEDCVVQWMEEVEMLAVRCNDRIVADIALTKSKISTYIAANDELYSATGANKRKLKKQYTIRCLEELKDRIDEYLQRSRVLLEETEVLCYKLAAVALEKGYVDYKQFDMQDVILHIRKDNDLLPAWINAIGTVGRHNAIVILTRAISDVL